MVTIVTRSGKGSELTHSEVDANFNNLNAATTQIDVSSQTASYTLVAGDAGQIVDMNSGSANNCTVPPNSSVAFPVKTLIFVRQSGAGATTLVAGSGVTLQYAGGLKVGGQHKMVALIKKATDTWQVVGGSA